MLAIVSLNGHSGVEDWDFLIFEQYETHEQLKERNLLATHTLNFLPNRFEKKEYLY